MGSRLGVKADAERSRVTSCEQDGRAGVRATKWPFVGWL